MISNFSGKNKLLIIGASGHGRVVADIALKINQWQHIVFLDDDETIESSMGIDVVGKTSDAIRYSNEYDIVVAIGNNKTREIIQTQLEKEGVKIVTLIHPSAIIGEMVELGTGTVVMAGVIINCCSKIGKGCIINTGVIIDHDNLIDDFVHISPGAKLAGTVKLGKSTWVGIGTVISNNVSIASNCVIGAGAAVVKDIPSHSLAVGVPAKVIKNLKALKDKIKC